MIRDNRNFIQLAYEILKPQLITYIESNLYRFYGSDWITRMRYDFTTQEQKFIDEICNPNLTQKNTNVRNLLHVFVHLYDKIFSANFSTKYSYHCCELILFHFRQWMYNYTFNNRETYKVIELVQTFMEILGMNIVDVNILRNEMLYIMAVETFGSVVPSIELPSLDSIYSKYSMNYHTTIPIGY